MKKILLSSMIVAGAYVAQAQTFPLVPISQVQSHAGMALNLTDCNDTPNPLYFNDTIRVQGVVLVKGGLAQSASGRQFWIRDIAGGGAYATLGIRNPVTAPTQPDDMLNIVAGDTVEITGIVKEFNGSSGSNDGETQIEPLANGVRIIAALDAAGAPAPRLLTIGDFNNDQRINKLESGEQWEGEFVEFQNVTVVEVLPFSNNTRVSFNVTDANGNKMNVSDRFAAARFVNGFVAPVVGDVYTSLKGIIIHSKNGCSTTGASNRGYELNPFDISHYQKGASAPSISSITRNPNVPTSTQAVTISATITDDSTVAAAKLFYAVGASSTTYTPLDMSNGGSGNVYTAPIPAQADGSLVKFYIRATDNVNNVNNIPNVPTSNPLFYVVRDAGLTIRDVQYTPYVDGNSGYAGQEVTVEGIITASAESSNLGYTFMQQEGADNWAGIWLSGAALATKTVGQKVRVTGTVQENFGITRIVATTADVIGTGNITPLTLSPNVFTAYSFANNEQYEGMLVKIADPVAGKSLYVVDTNADASAPANFGEYRVGLDKFDPASGMRVLAGRQTSSTYSSLAVSYVNNPKWATTDGNMSVPVIRVMAGDSVASITGIAYFGFNNMKLLPRNNADFTNFVTDIRKNVITNCNCVAMFPNPATSELNMRLKEAGTYTVAINDITGRKVLNTVINGDSKISTAALQSGIYIVIITNAQGQQFNAGRLAIVK